MIFPKDYFKPRSIHEGPTRLQAENEMLRNCMTSIQHKATLALRDFNKEPEE